MKLRDKVEQVVAAEAVYRILSEIPERTSSAIDTANYVVSNWDNISGTWLILIVTNAVTKYHRKCGRARAKLKRQK